MFSAVIKGTDTGAASVVARAHGFRTVRVHAELDDAVTLILTWDGPPQAARERAGFPGMIDWYNEDLGRSAPFPSGSLFYFRELSPEETMRETAREKLREADAFLTGRRVPIVGDRRARHG